MVISRPDLLQDGLLRLKRELAGSLRSVEELMRVATKNNPLAAKKLAAVKKTLERANDLLG